VLAALEMAGAEWKVPAAGIRRFAHGTTVATNAVLERKGARIGLLTTKGFEDTVRIMRGMGRPTGEPPETLLKVAETFKPEPLVPADRVFGFAERIDSLGDEVVALDEDVVAAAVQRVQADGERLEQRARLVGDGVGQRDRRVGREAHSRREAAVRAQPDRARHRAEVVPARAAGRTDAAAPAGVGGHAIADRHGVDVRADRGDDRRELVAERHRRLLTAQPVRPARPDRERAVGELADVAAADAAEAHLRLDHARVQRQLEVDVVKADVAAIVPTHSEHGATL
jgi:hypothetical protein